MFETTFVFLADFICGQGFRTTVQKSRPCSDTGPAKLKWSGDTKNARNINQAKPVSAEHVQNVFNVYIYIYDIHRAQYWRVGRNRHRHACPETVHDLRQEKSK